MRCFNPEERREMRAKLLAKFGPYCQICLRQGKSAKDAFIRLDLMENDLSFSFDHILALADGGENVLSNMHPAHIVCNSRKGSISGGSRRMDKESRKRSNKPKVSGNRLAYSSVSA
jgi:5-methylcytosine-specific restriction endonuclease McrA